MVQLLYYVGVEENEWKRGVRTKGFVPPVLVL